MANFILSFIVKFFKVTVVVVLSVVVLFIVFIYVKIYFIGYGYSQPLYKIPELTRRAELGDVEAASKLRFHYEGKGDMNMALYWLRKGAAFGDKEAQRQLYHWLAKSTDEASRDEAFKNLMKAGENGDGIAQLELSNLFFSGRGVNKDVIEGEIWLRRSAKSLFPPAMVRLSTFILERDQNRNSLVEAYAWAKMALNKVHPKSVIASDATRQLDIIKKRVRALGMSEAELDAKAEETEREIQSNNVQAR